MSKKSYYDLLKHPKWQQKRLEVLERAGFACAKCGDKETTLHVHHGFYRKGAKPWEYDAADLHCLCEPCHTEVESVKQAIDEQLGALLGAGGLDEVLRAAGYIRALLAKSREDDVIETPSRQEAIGIADGFRIEFGYVVTELCQRGGVLDVEDLRAYSVARWRRINEVTLDAELRSTVPA